MTKKTKNKNALSQTPQVGCRIPKWARDHYQEVAIKERRLLSQVLRIALEDHAKSQMNGNGRRRAP